MDEVLVEVMCPAILTGIGEVVTASDLLDRTVALTLPVIRDRARRSEEEFWRDFAAAAPSILGGLFDVISDGLRRLPSTHPAEVPRMADFARWITACEPALGWEPGSFIASFKRHRARADVSVVEASPIGAPLRTFARSVNDWTGTVAGLLNALHSLADDNTRTRADWPRNAKALSEKLRRLAPNLRTEGVLIEPGGRGNDGRQVRVRVVPQEAPA